MGYLPYQLVQDFFHQPCHILLLCVLFFCQYLLCISPWRGSSFQRWSAVLERRELGSPRDVRKSEAGLRRIAGVEVKNMSKMHDAQSWKKGLPRTATVPLLIWIILVTSIFIYSEIDGWMTALMARRKEERNEYMKKHSKKEKRHEDLNRKEKKEEQISQ